VVGVHERGDLAREDQLAALARGAGVVEHEVLLVGLSGPDGLPARGDGSQSAARKLIGVASLSDATSRLSL
jgi:hypothetical protein